MFGVSPGRQVIRAPPGNHQASRNTHHGSRGVGLLPIELAEVLMDAADNFPGRTWGVREFVRRVAEATGDDEETARAHAEAVLTVLAKTIWRGLA
ncbi:DUF2267 domain-containing protein [Streptomyces sp. TRM70350]|uniref:DUF2267 domain-containing protein n=1 Tax=Streptomyces sp. TRM70350 TaxID=2856165 RepID=UPI0027E14A87|nr:DUF2267 domain-containing protein [Streptomyces sp. TRM70350]